MVLVAALFARVPAADAERVIVEFEAEAATVVDQPFGMEVPRLTIVRGCFGYESDTEDLNPNDTRRGSFLLAGTWDFRAEFLDKVITGSGTATATTNTFGSPTLSFEDGFTTEDSGIMSLDSVPDEEIGLNFRISGRPEDLPTDQLPSSFGFAGAPHTFVLADESGRMLLQLRSFRQVQRQDHAVKFMSRTGDVVHLIWWSFQGNQYDIEFSTDLKVWNVIRPNITGEQLQTSLDDDLAERFTEGPIPRAGYYRVIDKGPLPP